MIATTPFMLVVRHDAGVAKWGTQLPDVMFGLYPSWHYDGKLWAMECMAVYELMEYADKLEALGFRLWTEPEGPFDVVFLELGAPVVACSWLTCQPGGKVEFAGRERAAS